MHECKRRNLIIPDKFKKDKGVELWLNKNKKWSKKDDRAGIKDYKKAENLLLNLLKDKVCITNQ